MARRSTGGGNIGGRGTQKGAKVTGGGNGKKQRIVGRGAKPFTGRHPGMSRGTKRVGG